MSTKKKGKVEVVSDDEESLKKVIEVLKEKSEIDVKTNHEFSLDETELPVSLAIPSDKILRSGNRKPRFNPGDHFYNGLQYKRVKGKIRIKGRKKLKFTYTVFLDFKVKNATFIDELELTLSEPIENLDLKRVFRNLIKDTYKVDDKEKLKGQVSYVDKNLKYQRYDLGKNKIIEKEKIE